MIVALPGLFSYLLFLYTSPKVPNNVRMTQNDITEQHTNENRTKKNCNRLGARKTWPEVIKLFFSFSTQLSMKFALLKNLKLLTIAFFLANDS